MDHYWQKNPISPSWNPLSNCPRTSWVSLLQREGSVESLSNHLQLFPLSPHSGAVEQRACTVLWLLKAWLPSLHRLWWGLCFQNKVTLLSITLTSSTTFPQRAAACRGAGSCGSQSATQSVGESHRLTQVLSGLVKQLFRQ